MLQQADRVASRVQISRIGWREFGSLDFQHAASCKILVLTALSWPMHANTDFSVSHMFAMDQQLAFYFLIAIRYHSHQASSASYLMGG
jgi:hypothetical protein